MRLPFGSLGVVGLIAVLVGLGIYLLNIVHILSTQPSGLAAVVFSTGVTFSLLAISLHLNDPVKYMGRIVICVLIGASMIILGLIALRASINEGPAALTDVGFILLVWYAGWKVTSPTPPSK